MIGHSIEYGLFVVFNSGIVSDVRRRSVDSSSEELVVISKTKARKQLSEFIHGRSGGGEVTIC
jgi:hypothetical protein